MNEQNGPPVSDDDMDGVDWLNRLEGGEEEGGDLAVFTPTTQASRNAPGRSTTCHTCGSKLTSLDHSPCDACGWLKCSCGGCGCNYGGAV